jgi:hypothetical protein
VVHEAHASGTQNAAVWNVEYITAKILNWVEAFRVLSVSRACLPFFENVVLQLAFSGLIADRAVERMVDEQEFEDAAPRLTRLFGEDTDDLTLRHRRGTGDLQLRCLFDFDEAHPAHARYREPRMVAVVRDHNTRSLRSL